MKDKKPVIAESGSDTRKMVRYIILSVLGHVVLFVLIIAIPDITPARKLAPRAVNVSLISAKDLPGASKNERSIKKRKRSSRKKLYQKSPKNNSKPHKRTKRTKRKNKSKKKKHKTSDEVKDAISMLKKEIEDTDSSELEETLNQLKKEVENQNKDEIIDRLKNELAQNKGSGKRIGNSIYGRQSIEIMRIYDAEIEARIETNWAYAGESSNMKAWLAIKIDSNGEIVDIWFDEKSGNSHLDDSAYNALMKSNPLPPLPEAYKKPHYIKGFKFGPEGLNK